MSYDHIIRNQLLYFQKPGLKILIPLKPCSLLCNIMKWCSYLRKFRNKYPLIIHQWHKIFNRSLVIWRFGIGDDLYFSRFRLNSNMRDNEAQILGLTLKKLAFLQVQLVASPHHSLQQIHKNSHVFLHRLPKHNDIINVHQHTIP